MTEPTTKRKIIKRSVSSLKPYPKQAEIFGDLPPAELKLLADDIGTNGLREPPETTSDDTIICGHQRVRAAKLLGWSTIECWVRSDLEEQGEDAVEARFLEDNLNRRQLSKLTIARTYRRRKELHADEWGSSDDTSGDLRDHLAERFDMSGRQLDRYVRMLDAPIVVQQAFERGELPQKQVLAFVRLGEEDQRAVLEAIEAGDDARQLIDEMPQWNGNKPWGIDRSLRSFNKAVRGLRNKLDGRMDKVRGCCSDHVRRDFDTGLAFLLELHDCIEAEPEQQAGDMEDFWAETETWNSSKE